MGAGSRPAGSLPSGNFAAIPGQSYGYAPPAINPAAAPPRSNVLVLVLIAILLVAIGVLAYLVITK